MNDPREKTVVQTHEPPMTDLDAVKGHAMAVRALAPWDRVGVLMDDGPSAIVVVLLDGEDVVSASRVWGCPAFADGLVVGVDGV